MPNNFKGNPTGSKSIANSTNRALDASESFVGTWEYSEYEHVAQNVISDQDGTISVDFGIVKDNVSLIGLISDDDVIVTLQSEVPVYANTPYFRSLVKMPGRVYRTRFINGPTPQGYMALLTGYGNNLFPASISSDNELLTTVVERERNVGVAYGRTVSSVGTEWACIIDLSDTTNWPHERTGSVELSIISINVDKPVSATGSVSIGVVTRIDSTDADITLVQGDSFNNSSGTEITLFRNLSPSQLRCNIIDGGLASWKTTAILTNVAAVNTATPLDSPEGAATVIPAVGDILIRYTLTAGMTYNAATQLFYHAEFI